MKRVKIYGSTNNKLLAVFWYINDTFVGTEAMLDSDNVIQFGDYLQLDDDHFEIWPYFRNELKLPKHTEYDEYPRGRVMFNVKIHKFVVIGNKIFMEDASVKKKLLSFYGLPSTTIFETDEHYKE